MDLGIDGLEWIAEVGSGGFGSVHRARDEAHGRDVAVKLLHASTDERSRRRFDRERRLMGSVSGHPNIVTVYTSGFSRHGTPYLVMELMTGGTLGDRIAERLLTAEEARSIGIELGEALAVAHDAGVLHLDIKPDNVLIGRRGEPQIADFGIASSLSEVATRQTISVSPAFTPLELLNNVDVDARTDVYSLGATLFNAVTGRLPYWREDRGIVDMIQRMREEAIPRAADHGVDAGLSDLLATAMATDPADRPATMREFVDRLRSLELGRAAETPAAAASVTVPLEPMMGDTSGPAGLAPRRGMFAGAAILLLVAVLGTIVWLASRSDDVAREPDPTPQVEAEPGGSPSAPDEPTTTPEPEPTATPTPDPEPTEPPTPEPTEAVAVQPPPRPAEPVEQIAWSTEVDPSTGMPGRVVDSVPPGSPQVCVSFDLVDTRPDVPYEFRWFHDGRADAVEVITLTSGPGDRYWSCHALDAGPGTRAPRLVEFEFLFDAASVFADSLAVGPRGPARVSIINRTDRAICTVNLSEAEATFWGPNDLPQPIVPGDSRPIDTVAGRYDYQVLDCDGALLATGDEPIDLAQTREIIVE